MWSASRGRSTTRCGSRISTRTCVRCTARSATVRTCVATSSGRCSTTSSGPRATAPGSGSSASTSRRSAGHPRPARRGSAPWPKRTGCRTSPAQDSRSEVTGGQPMAPARSGIHHLELGSRDLERSRDFYQGLLGFDEVEVSEPRRDGESTCWFAAGPALVKVVLVGESGDPGSWLNEDLQGGLRHAGFKVGDIDAQMRRLEVAGVEVLSPPRDVLGNVRIAFFLDPDGARLEFVQGGLRHAGFKVGDIDAQMRRLEAAGVEVLSPPRDVPGDVRIAFFLDPDGARLELV